MIQPEYVNILVIWFRVAGQQWSVATLQMFKMYNEISVRVSIQRYVVRQ